MFDKRIPFMIENRHGINKKVISIGSEIQFDDGSICTVSKIQTVELLNGGICRVIGMCKPTTVSRKEAAQDA